MIISIFSNEHLQACKQVFERTGKKPKVHVKLDTGMNRIGVRSEDGINYINKVRAADFLSFEGVFTHLAAAEEPDEAKKQIDRWNSVIENIDTTDDCTCNHSNCNDKRQPPFFAFLFCNFSGQKASSLLTGKSGLDMLLAKLENGDRSA